MTSPTDQEIKNYKAISFNSFTEIDFNEKKKEAKKILRHQETLDYALEVLEMVKQLYQQISKKLSLYRKGNLEYGNSIVKDLELIQNNYLEKSKFPRIPDIAELEALEALIFPIKNLCSRLQAQLVNEHAVKKEKELEGDSRKYKALSKLLQEEQEALNKEAFFRNFLIRIKKEFGDKNPQPKGIYFAYAWPTEKLKKKEGWVQNFLKILKEHLETAGLTTVRLDVISNRYGGNIYEYMQRAEKDDYVLLFGTESLKEKHDGGVSAVCTEIIHILKKREKDKEKGTPKVFPILLSGSDRTVFPVEYERYVIIKDWRKKGYLFSFQELYLELLNLAPEYYLCKMMEIGQEEFAKLSKEAAIQVEKIIKKNEENREKFLTIKTPNLSKDDQLALQMPLRKESKLWWSKVAWLLIITLVGTALLLSAQTYWSFFHFKRDNRSIKVQKLFAVKNTHPDFVGRKEYLADLAKVLLTGKKNALSVAVLWGEGGVGKSELAIAFANKHFKEFSFVYWIESEIDEAYDQCYRNLAKELRIDIQDQESPKAIRAKVHAYLEKEKFSCPWLLIFDDLINPLDLPQKGDGSIIITSRNHSPWRSFHCINVMPFNKAEALELFEKITYKKGEEARISLIEELDYLPVVLNQVAHYIAETPGVTDKRYLELLKDNKASVLKHMPLESRYPYNLAASWQITARHLYTHSKETIEWLYFCSYLYSASIPQAWIEKWLSKYKAELDNDQLQRKLRANNILRNLVDYSLVRYDEKNESIYLPSLKQEVFRSDKDCKPHIKQDVLAFLNEAIKDLEDIEEMWIQGQKWNELYQWEPHAAWFLGNFANQIESKELAILQNGLGNWRYIKGDFKNAEVLHNKSLLIRKKLFKKDSPFIAISMYNLAKVLDNEDKYKEAQELYEKALEISCSVFGKESLEVANNMHSLAWLLRHKGKYIEAKKLAEQALAMKKKFLKAEDPRIASSQYSLGWILTFLGRYEEAKKILEQALEANKRFLPEGHPYISNCMRCLGKILGEQGKYEEAKKLLEQALIMYKKSFGEEHSLVSDCMFRIGQVLAQQGKYEEAKKIFQRTMEMDKKIFGEAHSGTAFDMLNLGEVLAKQAKYDEARTLIEKALEIDRKLVEEKHPNVIRCLYRLGVVLAMQGYDEEAIKMLEQVLDAYKDIFEGEHPYIAFCMQHLGQILTKQSKFDEAEELIKAAMLMNEKLFGKEHLHVASCMQDLGWILEKKGRYKEAKIKIKIALEIYLKFLGYEHPSVAKVLNNLGMVYFSLGNFKRAKKLLEQSLEIYKKTIGISHPFTIETKNNLRQVTLRK